MTRFLLTFLALLTGLAATGAPASARVQLGDGAEVGALASAAEGVCLAAQGQGEVALESQPSQRDLPVTGSAEQPSPCAVPAVLIRIDRAHE